MPKFTKHDLEAQLQAFLNPPPMTIDQAMESADPVAEVHLRLTKRPREMSAPELTFYAVMYYIADTNNGGLEQTLTNDTGGLTDIVVRFADEYGDPALRQVMWEICNLFPNQAVPFDREERSNVVDAMSGSEAEKLSGLSLRLCQLDPSIREGLLKLLKEHRASFTLSRNGR